MPANPLHLPPLRSGLIKPAAKPPAADIAPVPLAPTLPAEEETVGLDTLSDSAAAPARAFGPPPPLAEATRSQPPQPPQDQHRPDSRPEPRPEPEPPHHPPHGGPGPGPDADLRPLPELEAVIDTSIVSDRPIDGSGTVDAHADWGAAGQTQLRLGPAEYADGLSAPVTDRPDARTISNEIVAQDGPTPSPEGVSDMMWAWGQFIDHDVTLTPGGGAFSPIPVPTGDAYFDPAGTGTQSIAFARSGAVEGTGETSPLEFSNAITAFIDASMVYGSDAATAESLRGEGGKLRMDDGDLLPGTASGTPEAGDVRVGENVGLTSLHTLFAREHNRIVDELAERDPSLSDDQLFDAARLRVEALVQHITFDQFLPVLVGEGTIPDYTGYHAEVNPGISVEFSTAAYRLGHSLLSSTIQRLSESGETIDEGNLALRDAFFQADRIAEEGGIDPILRGLADGTAQALDVQIVDDVRNFLFGPPGAGGLDLASLNIERGRDHGLPDYNELREAIGLPRAEDFSDITSDPDLAAALERVYGSVDLIDAWVGGLAEDPVGGGLLGETFGKIVAEQFIRLRDGDPEWAEGKLSEEELAVIKATSLGDIIERNTDVGTVQDDTFHAYDRQGGSEMADILDGTDGRDLLLGEGGNDRLTGADGDDHIAGGAGNDTLVGGAGEDVLDGGEGFDVVRFDGAFAGFGVDAQAGKIQVIDLSAGAADTLEAVEEIRFDDGAFSLDGIMRALARFEGEGPLSLGDLMASGGHPGGGHFGEGPQPGPQGPALAAADLLSDGGAEIPLAPVAPAEGVGGGFGGMGSADPGAMGPGAMGHGGPAGGGQGAGGPGATGPEAAGFGFTPMPLHGGEMDRLLSGSDVVII